MTEHGEYKKVLVSSGIGSVMETYDFSLYIFFSPIIAPLFFPTTNKLASLIATFAIFAIGYFVRPLGAILFGYFGDKIGRKKILIFSILMMGFPTFLIGFIPTYAQIGIAAPIFLLLVRVIQGLSTGSEFPGASVFVAEHAPPHKRGFFCSWIAFSINLGLVLGAAAGALVTVLVRTDQLSRWGWRIPFWAGIILAGVGYYLRTKVSETPLFLYLTKKEGVLKNPFKTLIFQHQKELIQGFGVILVAGAVIGVVYVYMSTYLTEVLRFSFPLALLINSFSILLLISLIPFMGILSDRFGRKHLLCIGCFGFLFFSYPLFLLMQMGLKGVVIAQICFAGIGACLAGTFGSALIELFPVSVRYSGVSFVYNFAYGIVSGSSPLIVTYLIHLTKNHTAPSFFLIFCGLLSLPFILNIKESAFKHK